jgi:hypothetical protein
MAGFKYKSATPKPILSLEHAKNLKRGSLLSHYQGTSFCPAIPHLGGTTILVVDTIHGGMIYDFLSPRVELGRLCF